jgi:DNA sulfur modification protein DndE
LKARTGVTPNILCRVALTLSLEQGKPSGRKPGDLDGNEFNAPTLFGEHLQVYETLIRQVHGELDAKQYSFAVAWHIDRGLEQLKRCKTLLDLSQLVVTSLRA